MKQPKETFNLASEERGQISLPVVTELRPTKANESHSLKSGFQPRPSQPLYNAA